MGRQIMFLDNLLHPIKKYKRVNSYIVLVITRFYLIKLTALVQKSFTTFNVERTILILRQCFNFTTVWTKFNRDFVHMNCTKLLTFSIISMLMSYTDQTCLFYLLHACTHSHTHTPPPPHICCMYVCKHMRVAYIHLYFVCFLKSELE